MSWSLPSRYTPALVDERLRGDALDIFRCGLAAADPYRLLREHSSVEGSGFTCETPKQRITWDLPVPGAAGRLLVVGAGKAAASLAQAIEETLADRIDSGRIVVKHGHGRPLRRIAVEEGGHPLPDAAGLAATRRLLAELEATGSADRVFFLLTGGASALLVAPAEGLGLEDKVATTRLLLGCGATIQELNAVRKHLSAVKGGRLMERVVPAKATTLIISDVCGDDLASIGSGPTAPDPSTFADCVELLDRYGLMRSVPARVLRRLKDGAEGQLPETPKPGAPLFDAVQHIILANNRQSVDAARLRAKQLGYEPEVFAYDMEGSTHERACSFTARLLEVAGAGPRALLAGGETTLEIKGGGQGGRNQEFALVAAMELEGRNQLLVLAAGTDGTDGPTDAAGAFADGTTLARARGQGRDAHAYLAANDAYNFFGPLGDLLVTGPTGTNVMDLVVGLVD